MWNACSPGGSPCTSASISTPCDVCSKVAVPICRPCVSMKIAGAFCVVWAKSGRVAITAMAVPKNKPFIISSSFIVRAGGRRSVGLAWHARTHIAGESSIGDAAAYQFGNGSPGERIGAKLESDNFRPVPLAALQVEHRPGGIGRPQRLALPAGIGVVDAPIHPLGEIADRVGHAQHDELAIHQRQQRVIHVAGGDRHVLTQTERVELIDPGVIARLDAAGFLDVSKLRAWEGIKRPALRTMVAGCSRSVDDLALTAGEAREKSTRQVRAEHA